jgi:hypothetical protein
MSNTWAQAQVITAAEKVPPQPSSRTMPPYAESSSETAKNMVDGNLSRSQVTRSRSVRV